MKKTLAVSFLLAVSACGGSGGGGSTPTPPPPTPTVVTITDPMSYLAQSRSTNGDASIPLRDTDQMIYRRTDIGGYQVEDSFLRSDGSAITTFEYPPFGPFVPTDEAGCPNQPCHGQGGEQYVSDGTTVRITATEDGGKPGVQTFPGPDGWVLFRTDAAADKKCLIAQIGSAQAYTCYWRQSVTFPAIGPVDTIVSEHYDSASPSTAHSMERFFLGHGWGRVGWEAFNTGPSPIQSNVAQRCPDFGFNTVEGFVLNDCRVSVLIVPSDGVLTGAQLWHP